MRFLWRATYGHGRMTFEGVRGATGEQYIHPASALAHGASLMTPHWPAITFWPRSGPTPHSAVGRSPDFPSIPIFHLSLGQVYGKIDCHGGEMFLARAWSKKGLPRCAQGGLKDPWIYIRMEQMVLQNHEFHVSSLSRYGVACASSRHPSKGKNASRTS